MARDDRAPRIDIQEKPVDLLLQGHSRVEAFQVLQNMSVQVLLVYFITIVPVGIEEVH